jgi:RloB-like protein
VARTAHDLRRRREPILPKRKFILLMEGENTEPDYFKAMRGHYRGALIDFEFVGAAGAPMTIAEKAVEKKRAIRRNAKGQSWQLDDQVWAVFDEDNHPKVTDAINICQNAGVGVAYSNPCFELWLILHHEDFGRQDDHHAVQRHLKSICPGYDPKGAKRLDCQPLMDKIEAAEVLAKRQRDQRIAEGAEHNRPVTTVFELTMAIRTAAKRKA